MSQHHEFDSLTRQLQQELGREDPFARLLAQEEEMESDRFFSGPSGGPQLPRGNPQIRWLQRALNRVSAFAIAEDGVLSVQTRRALQKFQADEGIRPTGKLGPRTRAALIEAGGIMAPRRVAIGQREQALGEMETPSGQCPADNPSEVRGFSRYSDDVNSLPPDQQKKLADIAAQLTNLANAQPDRLSEGSPIAQVLLIGHADRDSTRESQEPGFLQLLSEKRAASVFSDLCSRMPHSLVPRLQWIEVGVGASSLLVSPARTEQQRQCNRRVEIRVLPKGDPLLTPDQHNHVDADFQGPGSFTEYYDIALQGTSGQYERPQDAEQKAREIALKVEPFLQRQAQDTSTLCSRFLGIQVVFKDALQGTASKYRDPDIVISKAYEIAQRAQFGAFRALRKLQWQRASLPQPISPDCVVVRGQVPGPANHVLCGTHGHILDLGTRTVIAHDLKEYKRHPRR